MLIMARSFLCAIALLLFAAAAGAQQSSISYVALNACCIAQDGQGNSFIVSSSAFPFDTDPTTSSVQATTITVVKMNPGGSQLWEFTFPAGNDGQAAAAAADAQGNLWIAGSAAASAQSSPIVGFIAQVDSAGALLYSGTFGGQDPTGNTTISAIAFDTAGNAYLAGSTSQSDFPTTSGAYIGAIPAALAGQEIFYGFVAKLAPSSQATPPYTLAYSTLLGAQQASSFASVLAVDSNGQATVAGATSASGFPVTQGAFQTQPPSPDANVFVTRLNAQGTGLVWSTLLGEVAGFPMGSLGGVALDSSGNVVLAGIAFSSNFPITAGAIQPQFDTPTNGLSSLGDGFVAKLDSTGASLLFSTYYGIASYAGSTAGSFSVPYAYLLDDNFAPPKLRLDAQDDIWITESLADPTGLALAPGSLALGDTVVAELAPDVSKVLFAELTPNGMAGQDLALNSDGSLTLIGPPRGVNFNAPVSSGFVLRQPRATPTGVSILGVADAAAHAVNNAVAPGEYLSIYGTGLGPAAAAGTQLDANGAISNSLGGTQVSFDGVFAPLLYVSENQINLLVPHEVAGSTQGNMVITSIAGSSQSLPFQIVAAQPNIFVVVNADGSFNSSSNPASPGDTVSILMSGAGLLDPNLPDGALAGSPAPAPIAAVQVDLHFDVFEGFSATTGTLTETPSSVAGIPGVVADLVRVELPISAQLVTAGPPPFSIAVVVGASTSPAVPIYVTTPSN